MKDRLKKFYHDHEGEIVRVTYYVVGGLVAAAAMNINMKKIVDGSKPVAVEQYFDAEKNVDITLVIQKNLSETSFVKPRQK